MDDDAKDGRPRAISDFYLVFTMILYTFKLQQALIILLSELI